MQRLNPYNMKLLENCYYCIGQDKECEWFSYEHVKDRDGYNTEQKRFTCGRTCLTCYDEEELFGNCMFPEYKHGMEEE